MLLLTFPVFVALFSFLFLGERPTRKLLLLIAIAWGGILLIIEPQFRVLNFAGLIALLAGLFSSIDVIAIGALRRNENPLRITVYFVALSSLISFPLMLQDFIWPSVQDWIALLGAGLAGTVAQVAISQAYGLDDTSRLAPLSYVSVVFAFAVGLFFWQEIPPITSVVGSLVVVYCCIRIARLEKSGPPVG